MQDKSTFSDITTKCKNWFFFMLYFTIFSFTLLQNILSHYLLQGSCTHVVYVSHVFNLLLYKIIYLFEDLAGFFAMFYSQFLIDYLAVPNFQAKATGVHGNSKKAR